MTTINRILKERAYVIPLLLASACSFHKRVPEVHVVEIRQMQFQPEVITVKKEDTVVFVNKDIVMHNVTEQSKAAWSSSPLPSGSSWKLVARESSDYLCTLHPVMKGRIQVQYETIKN
jgi:plastocyanin